MVAQATSVIVLLGLNCIKDCKYRTLKVGKRLAGPVLKILLNYPQVCFHFSSTKYHGSEVHPSHVKSFSTELSISPDLWAYSSGNGLGDEQECELVGVDNLLFFACAVNEPCF